jgi:hypothetical protein
MPYHRILSPLMVLNCGLIEVVSQVFIETLF